MFTIKNCQILLYCHFNKIIKESGTSFEYPILSQKHVRNFCLTAYYYLTKFLFQSTQDSKEISISGNSTTSMHIMTLQILKSVDFTKAQNSRYISRTNYYFLFKLKKWALLNHASTSSTQLISASTQLSATPSTLLGPKYCT